jgi:hypothetical protein
VIDKHALHGYLLAGGWNTKEFAAMSAAPRKAAKYLVSFSPPSLRSPK